jgi:hypothetical protein
MHIDLRKGLSLTIEMALFGTVSLVILNGLEIAAPVWGRVLGGEGLLASVQVWIGYSIFVVPYATAASVYITIGRPPESPGLDSIRALGLTGP